MKQYKVVKEFDSAKKGDILTYNEEVSLFIFDINEGNGSEESEYNSSRFMAMDESTADKFVEDGYLIKMEEDCCSCKQCDCNREAYDKLNKIDDLITTLSKEYAIDMANIEEKYNNQEIPACVKIEADTVYFNMNKILDKIANIINE